MHCIGCYSMVLYSREGRGGGGLALVVDAVGGEHHLEPVSLRLVPLSQAVVPIEHRNLNRCLRARRGRVGAQVRLRGSCPGHVQDVSHAPAAAPRVA